MTKIIKYIVITLYSFVLLSCEREEISNAASNKFVKTQWVSANNDTINFYSTNDGKYNKRIFYYVPHEDKAMFTLKNGTRTFFTFELIDDKNALLIDLNLKFKKICCQ